MPRTEGRGFGWRGEIGIGTTVRRRGWIACTGNNLNWPANRAPAMSESLSSSLSAAGFV
jgi:hypothetical protein